MEASGPLTESDPLFGCYQKLKRVEDQLDYVVREMTYQPWTSFWASKAS